jgi:TonB family protein
MSLSSIRQFARRVRFCLSLIAVLGFLAAPRANAQQAEINNLGDVAAKMAQSLRSSGQKKVAVFDFVGPGQAITALGTKLADDFSLALSQSGAHLRVEDRRGVAGRMKKMEYEPEDSLDSGSVLLFAQFLRLNAAVFGTIARDGDQVKVSVRAVRVGGKRDVIDSRDAAIAISDESAKQIEMFIVRPETDAGIDKSFPLAGKGGRSFPRCIYCPAAQYSDAAVDVKFEGTVTLVAVVTAVGRATNIRVAKRAPFGLTNKAIEAVQQWRFEPAKDSDGKPVAVRQIIEVSFHLY